MEAPFLITSTNWLGIRTLYQREVWRFLKVWNQTMMSPIITTLIWLAILTLALGGRKGGGVEALPFDVFIAPGLIMMVTVQNAFANTSSSLMLGKMQGVIIDMLMPPLKGREVAFCLLAGGVTRGVLVAVTVGIAISFFVPLSLPHPFLALVYLLLASAMLAQLGMLGGIWAHGFDQMTAMTNYIVTPLSFLSGTFYSINILPGIWSTISHYNPFFFMIDGFRYALTGYHDGNIQMGMIVLVVINFLLWLFTSHLIASGWRIKS